MNIQLLCVEKLNEYWKEAAAEYQKRPRSTHYPLKKLKRHAWDSSSEAQEIVKDTEGKHY